MNLEDALGGGTNNQQGGLWPGQSPDPVWPGQSGGNPVWNGGNPSQPMFPGGNPSQPMFPGGNPSQPMFPGGNPSQPTFPGGNPSQPTFPGGNPSQPTFPGGNPFPAGGWNNPTPGPGPAIPAAAQHSLVVPFVQNLPSGVYDKLLITINGTVKHNAEKFMVDLYTSSNDLAFHFNPRFNEYGKKVIVRNSRFGQKWGKEERELTHFPFVQGQPFELKIMCTNTAFKVAVNNSHLLEYKHRITNLGSITRLNIINDVTLSNFKMETMR